MTNPLPPVMFDARPVAGSGYGLYAAATIIDTGEVARHLGGVTIRPYNCDTGVGTYSTDLCDDDPAVKAAGERAENTTFDAMVVYAASECAPDSTEDEVLSRAAHTRTLHEPLLVESAFATRMLSGAGAPATAADLPTAIGMMEEFLGEQGYQGYIHAARRWAAPASQYRWSNQTGATLRTPLDHQWVFGGGYADVLGNTLVATGPLYIWRNAPFERVVTTGSSPTPEFNNNVYGLSERVVVVGYECAVYAVTIETPTEGA
jgi:hypothetical protein